MVARMTIEGNAAIYRAALERANAGDLAERWSTADMLGLLIQAGAVQPPAA
jgi:hypothetical protein